MKVILHADDFGLSYSFNAGIIHTHQNGYLTSTCLRTNGVAFENAVEYLRTALDLGIGIHINLIEGKTNRDLTTGSVLCDANGNYRHSFQSLLLGLGRNRESLLNEIELEMRQQIEMILEKGIRLDHINSHQHTHAIPAIFRIACKLAVEYGIPYIRLPREPFYTGEAFHYHLRPWWGQNLVKLAILNNFANSNNEIAREYDVQTSDHFIGIQYTNHMTDRTVWEGLRAAEAQGANLVEVLLHPCKIIAKPHEEYISPYLRSYIINPDREVELQALIDPTLPAKFREHGYELTSYKHLAGWTSSDEVTLTPPEQKRIDYDQPKLRTFVIIDETPLYHPTYLSRIIHEIDEAEIVGGAIVVLPNGGVLQQYLLKNIFRLRVFEVTKLGLKKVALQLAGLLPRWLRGSYESTVRTVLDKNNIPYRVVKAVNSEAFHQYVKSFEPDLILSSNSLIFKKDLLAIPKVASINRHSALLPANGGILPVLRAIQHGEAYTGASIHYMVPEIDKGAVLSRQWLPIFEGDTLDRLYRLCFILSFEGTRDAIQKLYGDPNAAPVDGEGLQESYYSFPEPEDWKEFRERRGRLI